MRGRTVIAAKLPVNVRLGLQERAVRLISALLRDVAITAPAPLSILEVRSLSRVRSKHVFVTKVGLVHFATDLIHA